MKIKKFASLLVISLLTFVASSSAFAEAQKTQDEQEIFECIAQVIAECAGVAKETKSQDENEIFACIMENIQNCV